MRVPVTTSEGRQHTCLSALCVIQGPEELPTLRTDCFFFSKCSRFSVSGWFKNVRCLGSLNHHSRL